MDKKSEEYVVIQYEIKKADNKKNLWSIVGTQKTIEMFKDLMEAYVCENKFLHEPESDSNIILKN